MVEPKIDNMDRAQRREASQVARKGIGRRLELTLEPVVREPIPGYWLTLLQTADHRALAQAATDRRRQG